jgi:hypothetical protein
MMRLSNPSVRALFGSVLVAAGLYACGGSQPAATTPPATTADAGAPAEQADAAAPTTSTPAATLADAGGGPVVSATEAPKFEDLPKDKKVEIMATKVVPNVGKLFKEYNAKHYEKFGCVTCHGPQKKDDPHNVLPKLTFSNGGFEKLQKTKPEMMKFMGEKVVPAMAEALGAKPFDPATKKGFGCGGCHTVN